jgi:hypothetical protein
MSGLDEQKRPVDDALKRLLETFRGETYWWEEVDENTEVRLMPPIGSGRRFVNGNIYIKGVKVTESIVERD